MFTPISNFTYGNYQISNIAEPQDNISLAMKIQITKSENESGRLMMGDCLYADLISQCEIDTETGLWKLKTGVHPKWSKLLYGETYEATEIDFISGCGCGCCEGNCSKHYWDGIVRKVITIGAVDLVETIFAPFIYRDWALNNRTLNLGVGEGNGDAQTATMSNTHHKRVDAWNEFVKNVAYGGINGRVSLHQYLREHSTEFPEAEMACFNVMTYL